MILSQLPRTPSAGPDGASAASQPSQEGLVVLAAVDVAEPDRGRDVLQMAASLASDADSGEAPPSLHVVYCWNLVGESILTCPVRGVSRARLRSLLSSIGAQHRQSVTELCEEVLPREADGIHVRRGDPRSLIPSLARRLRADLLVLGGPVRTGRGLSRFLPGSVARAVAGEVSCDVVTVRGRFRW